MTFEGRARAVHGGKYDYSLSKYAGAKQKVEIVCPSHGPFWQAPDNHINGGRGCPTCGLAVSAARTEKKLKDAAAVFVSKCRAVHGDKYDYSDTKYCGSSKPVTIVCPDHGEFEQTAMNHLKGHGCKHCGVGLLSATRTLRGEVSFLEFTLSSPYTYPSSKYAGAKVKVEIVCPTHGSFWQAPDNHINGGRGCPTCATNCGGGPSSAETEIANWVRSLGETVKQSDRTAIRPREIDIWVPEKRVGIEYHGLYWHTENKVGNMHAEKYALASAAGIRLIQVYEDEWVLRKSAVKQVILNALGRVEDRVHARKCAVVGVDQREARAFFESHHVQGAGGSTIHLGLEHAGRLVAVMGFGNPTSGRGHYKAGAFELSRYATACSVVGGASRLLSKFRGEHPGAQLVSYVDHRYFNGGMYLKLGFSFSRSSVDYEYVFKGRRVHKSALKKDRLKLLLGPAYNANLTERVMAESAGAKRLLNAGRTTYILEPQ